MRSVRLVGIIGALSEHTGERGLERGVLSFAEMKPAGDGERRRLGFKGTAAIRLFPPVGSAIIFVEMALEI
jgi:hypothetical protein